MVCEEAVKVIAVTVPAGHPHAVPPAIVNCPLGQREHKEAPAALYDQYAKPLGPSG